MVQRVDVDLDIWPCAERPAKKLKQGVFFAGFEEAGLPVGHIERIAN
jgi:hypothetical protein